MKTALVTGASGYLGGHVTRRLLTQDWRVLVLLRPGSMLPGDIAERVERVDYDGTLASAEEAFAQAPVDVVLHLASAVVSVHTADQLDTILDANIRLPTHLLEAMRGSACRRFVNTGSFWQHCNSDAYCPVNLYAATKQAFEDIARAYVENDGLQLATLILFDTYGADDPRRKIVRLLTEAAGAAEPLRLSPGDQLLDLTHAEDVAQAFVVAGERLLTQETATHERFRVSGQRITLKQLVALVNEVAGSPISVELGATPYRPREIMQPIADAVPPLPGWVPKRDLPSEIRLMISAARSDGQVTRGTNH